MKILLQLQQLLKYRRLQRDRLSLEFIFRVEIRYVTSFQRFAERHGAWRHILMFCSLLYGSS